MVSVNDLADHPARALAGGEIPSLGRKSLRWLGAPPRTARLGERIHDGDHDAHDACRGSLHPGR
jgi:hypothetical protein